jgi:hypothetical protein
MLRQKEGETERRRRGKPGPISSPRRYGFGLNSAALGGLKSRPSSCKPKPLPVSPQNAVHASFCCCRETLHGLPHEAEAECGETVLSPFFAGLALPCPLLFLACRNILHCTCTLIDSYVPCTAALSTLFLFWYLLRNSLPVPGQGRTPNCLASKQASLVSPQNLLTSI